MEESWVCAEMPELNRLFTLHTGHVASVQAYFSVARNISFWLTTLKRTEK
jgi:hypothetical protein